VFTRGFVLTAARDEAIATGGTTRPAVYVLPGDGASSDRAELAVRPVLLPGAEDSAGCTSLVGEDATYWLNWAVGKVVSGGVQLPGMGEATKGLVEYVLEARGRTAWQTVEKVKSITNLTSAIANVLSLAMQLSSLTLDATMEPTPLERTKGTSDGKQAVVSFRVTYQPGNLPDGRNMAACLASYMLNTFGVPLNFPVSGARVAGAELTFEGGDGFDGRGNRVLFGKADQLRQDTNDVGEADLLILGRAQKTKVSDSATPVNKEFSVVVSGQPEAANGNSIANTFFDSLLFWVAPGGAGAVNAAVDIAKTFHYSLGEPVFGMVDWSTGYAVDVPFGSSIGNIFGTVCALDQPFTLKLEAYPDSIKMVGAFTFTPTDNGGGKWSFSGNSMEGLISIKGMGTYRIEGLPPSDLSIVLGAGQWKQRTAVGNFDGPNPPGAILPLEPAQTSCPK
jgi:hypothetical protein